MLTSRSCKSVMLIQYTHVWETTYSKTYPHLRYPVPSLSAYKFLLEQICNNPTVHYIYYFIYFYILLYLSSSLTSFAISSRMDVCRYHLYILSFGILACIIVIIIISFSNGPQYPTHSPTYTQSNCMNQIICLVDTVGSLFKSLIGGRGVQRKHAKCLTVGMVTPSSLLIFSP